MKFCNVGHMSTATGDLCLAPVDQMTDLRRPLALPTYRMEGNFAVPTTEAERRHW